MHMTDLPFNTAQNNATTATSLTHMCVLRSLLFRAKTESISLDYTICI